jgi:hypothetical protein
VVGSHSTPPFARLAVRTASCRVPDMNSPGASGVGVFPVTNATVSACRLRSPISLPLATVRNLDDSVECTRRLRRDRAWTGGLR